MPDKPAKSKADSPNPAKSPAKSPSKGAAKTRPRKPAKGKPALEDGGTKGARKKQRAKRAEPAADTLTVSADASPKPPSKASRPAKRRPPRQTFLVAATLADTDGTPRLRVYAAVVRGPAEALAAVRAELGPDVPVELTGKLSNRMGKALGLKPDEVRPV